MILLAMGINAVSYNLVSGTREALTYDSLLEAGEEKNYLKVASRQDFLYEGLFAFTNLMSIVTVAIGYQKAYFLSILQGILCTVCAASLQEAMEGQRTFGERRIAADLFREVGAHFLQTAVFFIRGRVCGLHAASGPSGRDRTGTGISRYSAAFDLSLFHGRSCADRKNRKNVSPVLLPGWWNSDRDLPLFERKEVSGCFCSRSWRRPLYRRNDHASYRGRKPKRFFRKFQSYYGIGGKYGL